MAVGPTRRCTARARAMARAMARSTVCGGYEYEFVEAIADKYNCGICMKVLRDAQLTVCCGHHYCETCLEQWLTSKTHEGKKTCPHCRKENFQSFPNKEKIREINEFKIRCSHRGKGCEWVGELGALKEHLESDKGCGYVVVRCTSGAYKRISIWALQQMTCGVAMERCNLANHQNKECVYRQCRCQYCGYTDTYDAIAGSGKIRNSCSNIGSPNNHLSECTDYPLDCPNECGEKNIKRKNMKRHQESCPLEPLDCPFKHVGCTAAKMVHKDKDSHCQENMQEHLLLVVQSHQQLAHKNKELEQELACTKQELSHKVNELAIRIEALTRK